MHRLAAVGAAQVDAADLAARVVAVEHWWPGLAGEPPVSPAGHDHEQVDQLGTLGRQVVLVTWPPVVGAASDDRYLDTTRLTHDTGFAPAFDVATAVADYVAWRADNPR